MERYYSGGKFEKLASYCRAVRAGDLIVVSGCAPIDASGAVIAPGDVQGQTAAAIEIALNAVVALGGQSQSVMRSRIFLAAGVDWKGAVRAHAEIFRGINPANTTLFVEGFIPPGVLVEVELDAFVGLHGRGE